MSTPDKGNLKDPELFKAGVEYLKKRDPKIKDIIDRHGVIQFAPGGHIFDSLIESIISQQLSGSAASSIIRRMRRLYASRDFEASSVFKTPPHKLRWAGVSPQKIRYLKDLSKRVVSGSLNVESLIDRPDSEVIESLDEVLGIGPWTVHMLLIFTLGRPDVLPVDDLGIRRSIENIYSLESIPSAKEIEQIAKPWHPYCTVASLYLWKEKDGGLTVLKKSNPKVPESPMSSRKIVEERRTLGNP